MALNREEQQLLKTGQKAIRDRLAFKEQLAAEIQKDWRRRQRIAARYKQGLFEKALKSAGIDPAEIKERQRAEDATKETYLKKLMPRVSANVKAVEQRHARQAKLIAKVHGPRKPGLFPGPPGPPPPGPAPSPVDVELLTLAAQATVADSGGTGTVASTGAWKNTLSTELIVNGQNSAIVGCDFNFFYGPKQSGLLKAWAFVSANGSFSWNTWSTCWGGTLAQGGVSAVLTIQQAGPDGALNEMSSTVFQAQNGVLASAEHDYGLDDHCLGDFGIDVMDGFQVIEVPGYFPALGGRLLQAVVSIAVGAQVDNASCDLDFLSGGRNINVLGVALQFF
jgi:hypothetical protein